MARGVNKVILVGNLGQDPQIKYLPSGSPVVNLSLATSESWKDKNTGQVQDRTEWHRLVIFGRLAEIAAQYLKKGSQIYVEGKLQTRKWQGQDGQDRYTTEINVNEMQMLGSAGGSGGMSSQSGGEFDQTPNYNEAPRSAPQQSAGFAGEPASQSNSSDFDDDIPF